MSKITWQQSLSTKQQAELYALYVLLCLSSLPLSNKQSAFESAADGRHSWPIVKVTINALKYIAENGHADLLRRAHGTKRADRARKIFIDNPLMAQTELLEYFFGLDQVTLAMAKSEAGRHGHAHYSEQIDVPAELFTRSGKGTSVYTQEFEWAVEYLSRRNVQFNKFVGKVRKQRISKNTQVTPFAHLAEDTNWESE